MSRISKVVQELVSEASFSLRSDVLKLLKSAFKKEVNKKAKKVLGWIIDNASIAKSEKLAICQDTGLPIVFIEAGSDVKIDSTIIEQIKKGIEGGYKNNYLRQSIVDPLQRVRPSYKGMIYHLNFSSKEKGLTLTVLPKGFGCENKSKLKMFNPTVDFAEIEKFIIKSVKLAGPEACPPFVVGVGFGGTSDVALLLAKKALISKVDKSNTDKFLNNLEKKLTKKINDLEIGPMGLGGKCTCLAVKIKREPTHIAGLPVGVNVSCWALRSARIKIKV